MAVFGVLYVLQTNSLSTKGYEIGDLQRQISALQHDNEGVEVDIASYRSMKSIQERLKKLSLVDATDTQYVNVVGTAVAER
jgi:cell division protein FtsL